MLNLKYLSLVLLLSLSAFATLGWTQEDIPVSDEEILIPPTSSSTTQPVILDETDSGSVPEVEDYDS